MNIETKEKTSGAANSSGAMRWLRRRLASFLLALGTAVVLFNAMIFMHAYSMTHFAESGEPPGRLEDLSVLQKFKLACVGVKVPRPVSDRDPNDRGIGFTTLRYPSTDGIELEAWHVPCEASRGLVLMFHGYIACKAALLPEARILHDAGYAMLLVDFRGCGGSTGNATTIGVTEAGDVKSTVEFARTRWPEEPIILYGQSMGSAAILCALHSDVPGPSAVVIESSFDRLKSAVESRLREMGAPTWPFANPLIFWGGVQHGFNGFRHNPAIYALAVRCPVLLMQGDQDHRVAPSEAEAIFANLGGPKELHWFAGVGHQSYAAARAAEWRQCVTEFLDRHLRLPERGRETRP